MATPSFQDFLNGLASKEDVGLLIKGLLDQLSTFHAKLQEQIQAHKGELSSNVQKAQQEASALIENLQKRIEQVSSDATNNSRSDARTTMRYIDEQMAVLKALIPDSTDLGPFEQRIAELAAKIPTLPAPLTADEIVRKINQDTQALIVSKAVEGLPELQTKVKQIELRPTGGRGGAKGIGLYVDGSKKLLTAQTLNLVAGTGISLSYAYASGRNDITISASASGGSMSVLAATGTVDDSNKVFTFASAPTLVVVNGNAYRNGHGVTISGTTATLDDAVGAGGDIYGLG
jgi:hypothetical protein